MATFLSNVENITPTGTSGWQQIDVSSVVRTDTVGIIIQAINSSGANRDAGWRMNGSSDSIINFLGVAPSHTWGVVGVDSGKMVNLFRDSGDVSYRLHGYFVAGEAHFLQNAFDPGIPGVNGWQDINISSIVQGGHTPIAACVDITTGPFGAGNVMVRHGDSTDTRRNSLARKSGFIIGVNNSNVFQYHNSGDPDKKAYVVGYIYDKAVFPANSPGNRAPTADGTWRNLTSALPSGAVGGAYFVFDTGTGSGVTYGLREGGSSDNVTHNPTRFWAFCSVKCNSSRIVQANLQVAELEVWEIGHFLASPEFEGPEPGSGIMIRGGLSGGFQ